MPSPSESARETSSRIASIAIEPSSSGGHARRRAGCGFALVDGLAARGVEEVELARVDVELQPLADPSPGLRARPGDERRAVLLGLLLELLEHLLVHVRRELPGVLRVDGRRVDLEMQEHVRAHALL